MTAATAKFKYVQYEALVKKILISLRGKKTQKEMSSKINFKFNQWHKWESGQKKLMWAEFHKICENLKIPQSKILKHIAGGDSVPTADGTQLFLALHAKYGRLNLTELKDQLEIPKAKLVRILKGEQDIEAYLILMFLGELTDALPSLLEVIAVDLNDVKYKKEIKKISQQRNLEAQYPWLAAVEALIEHRDYKKLAKHQSQFFTKNLGLSKNVLTKSFSLLEKNGAIEFKNHKYHLNQKRVDMEGATLVESAQLAKFWTQICLERFATLDGIPASGKGWLYRIFPVSKDAQDKIKKKLIELNGDIHNILLKDASKDKEFVQVLMLHFFDQSEISKIPAFQKIPNFEKKF